MGLKARVLRLARRVADGSPAPGLVWVDWTASVCVDRAALGPGDRVVVDVVLTSRRWPDQPDEGREVERVACGPEDVGRILDVEGRCLGVVRDVAGAGRVLEFGRGYSPGSVSSAVSS